MAGLKVTTPSDREIVMTRDFNAPRSLVFDCWTKPELVKRWLLGPAGWSMPVCQIDLRVGGAYRFVWRHVLNGYEMAMGGIYREIARPDRLVVRPSLFDEKWYTGDALGTMVFTERSGTTTLAQTILYESSAGPRHGARPRRWRKASPPISTGSPRSAGIGSLATDA